MAKRQMWEVRDGYCTTTDGTTHVAIVTFDISTGAPGGGALNNCSIFIEARCAGYDTTSSTAGGESIAGLFKVVAGTLSQVGASTHVTGMIDDIPATPNTDFSVSGNVITYYVIGSTGETIEWFGRMALTIYQPA